MKFTMVKQNGKDCTKSISIPPADVEQSCTGLQEQSILDPCRLDKQKPNLV